VSEPSARPPSLPLPRGERVLWQGAPAWRAVFLRVFHARTLVAYFVLMLAVRAVFLLADGAVAADAAMAVAVLLPLPLFALGMLALMAWLVGRTSRYTITDRRVVMKVGVVLDVTFNFPFRVIESAALKSWPGGSGDISIAFLPGNQIGYAHLWPHARPWRLRRVEPTLRCVPAAAAVAAILARALAEATSGAARAVSEPREAPIRVRAPSAVAG
jgi:hypothetical protein